MRRCGGRAFALNKVGRAAARLGPFTRVGGVGVRLLHHCIEVGDCRCWHVRGPDCLRCKHFRFHVGKYITRVDCVPSMRIKEWVVNMDHPNLVNMDHPL